jgi:hypothetical protein
MWRSNRRKERGAGQGKVVVSKISERDFGLKKMQKMMVKVMVKVMVIMT